jgi:hypothetical protein
MSQEYPEWITTESEQKLHDSFVHFVWFLWRHLKLPTPTKRQRAICRYLQNGPRRRMIQAFRGVGKSWLTCAYALWRLYRNPQERIKIVSANEDKATENAVFIRRLIDEVPELQFLRPRGNQRDAVLAFDVGPSDAHPTPSVSAVGITGQLTGGRATILIPDDVEVPKNSYTEGMRERLAELIKEFDALVVPEGFDIVFLGTPQTEQSIYRVLRQRGYHVRVWPARYPTPVEAAKYDGSLAEDILADIASGAKPGTSTEPERFSDLDLAEREASFGRSGFALQFMLDTTLSDALRYPLKMADLIYFDCHHEDTPVRLAWASDPRLAVTDIANIGFAGDRLYRPLHASEQRSRYEGAVMVIDPSGRGKDHTAVGVGKSLAGMVYLTALKGMQGGYEPATLEAIAVLAKIQQVKHIWIESNFGDGMFQKLIEPYFARIYPCTIEEYRSTGQKELRIIDDLEPVLNQHRLVIDGSVAREDSKIAEDEPRYSFMYQLTHLTKQRGALRHDDKVEVVAKICRYFRNAMAVDHELAEKRHREQLRDEEFKKFEENALGHSTRRPQRFVQAIPRVLRRDARLPPRGR